MAQSGQQGQAPRRLHPLQVRRVLLRRPRPPGVHQLLRHVREQVRGQLQPPVTALGNHRRRQPISRQLHRTQFSGQPLGQPILVLLGVRPEPVRFPNLLTVSLDPVALPVVVRPRPGGDLHLLGNVLHRRGGHLLRGLREPGLHLEKLEQQREAQPGRPGLVPHLLHVVFEQRPDLDQVFRLPVLPHPLHPSQSLVQLNEAVRAGKRKLWKLLSATRHLAVAIREQGRHKAAIPVDILVTSTWTDLRLGHALSPEAVIEMSHTLDLSMLPAERRRFLAGVGRRLTPGRCNGASRSGGTRSCSP